MNKYDNYNITIYMIRFRGLLESNKLNNLFRSC